MGARGDRLPRAQCRALGCDRDQVAKGWCLRHYKQVQRGIDPSAPTPQAGDRSGYGLYGVIDDDGHSVLCHECGGRYASVGSHIGKAHDVTARDYKQRHGIGAGTPLISRRVQEAASERARARLGTPGWAALEAARDPAAASRARDPNTLRRRAEHRSASVSRARVNGASVRRGTVYSCVVCGVQWCQLAGHHPARTCSATCWRIWQAVMSTAERPSNTDRDRTIRESARRGVTMRELADRHGVTTTRIRQIIYGR